MVEKELNNLRVKSSANIFFNGRVISRTCYREDGSRLTLGVITPGIYTFSVGDKEIVRIIAGRVAVFRPEDTDWVTFNAPDCFEIQANCEYRIRTDDVVEYLCDYYAD